MISIPSLAAAPPKDPEVEDALAEEPLADVTELPLPPNAGVADAAIEGDPVAVAIVPLVELGTMRLLLLAPTVDADADEDVELSQVDELEIVTLTQLQTLAKSFIALWMLLPQFWQIYCSTWVALLPLHTAFKRDGLS